MTEIRSVRDSVIYSVLASEWPAVRRNLEWRLAGHPSSLLQSE